MRKPTRRICSTGAAGAKQSWGGIVALPLAAAGHQGVDPLDRLPDDLVIAVLAGLAAGATCPADLAAAALTLVTLRPPVLVSWGRLVLSFWDLCHCIHRCRRFRELAAHPAVLSRASPSAVTVRARRWSEPACQFLRRCAAAGNLHACYFLGMVLAGPNPLLCSSSVASSVSIGTCSIG